MWIPHISELDNILDSTANVVQNTDGWKVCHQSTSTVSRIHTRPIHTWPDRIGTQHSPARIVNAGAVDYSSRCAHQNIFHRWHINSFRLSMRVVYFISWLLFRCVLSKAARQLCFRRGECLYSCVRSSACSLFELNSSQTITTAPGHHRINLKTGVIDTDSFRNLLYE